MYTIVEIICLGEVVVQQSLNRMPLYTELYPFYMQGFSNTNCDDPDNDRGAGMLIKWICL